MGAGMAIGAKLAFYDIGDSSGNLYLPSSISSYVFATGYKAGARVHTNSWGSTSNSYSSYDTRE